MLDRLYENIGIKIKNLAKWSFAVEAIGVIIGAIIWAVTQNDGLYFIIVAPIGVIAAWIGSWVLYGFGELIEAACETKETNKKIHYCLQAKKWEKPAQPNFVAQPVVKKEQKVNTVVAENTVASAVKQPAAETTEKTKNELPKYEKPKNIVLQPGEKWCPHCGKIYKSLFCGCGVTDNE